MIHLAHISPVTDFVRNYKAYLTRIKETGQAEVLTVNGKPECVIVDPARFQEMSEAFERAQFVKAVKEGIDSMNLGKGKPAEEAFAEIRAKLEL